MTHDIALLAELPGHLHVYGSGQLGGTGKGVLSTKIVELPVLSMGNLELRSVPIDVQLAASGGDKRWSLLGNELLKRANITWDIPNKRMYFLPNRLAHVPYAVPPTSWARIARGVSAVLVVAGIAVVFHRRRKR